MIKYIKQIIKPKYDTLNVIKIKADNLLANFSYLSELKKGADIFPVLKSNAYGHGLKEVCRILDKSSAKMVAVDSYPEAQIVYKYFHGKVLIIGEMPLKAYSYTKLKRTEFAVYTTEVLEYLSRYGKNAKIHLFFNSGMNREGIKNIDLFINENKALLDKVDVVGFCSHLASADEESELNNKQKESFFTALDKLKAAGFNPKHIHIGNSAGLFTLNDQRLNAFRPGLAFYGYSPFNGTMVNEISEKTKNLKPALEVFSKLMTIQKIESGESVSYNEAYKSAEGSTIGIIPFGYFEGLDRRLSNCGTVKVFHDKNSFYAKIAGRVCMNLSCLNLGGNVAAENDIVQIISSLKEDNNSLTKLSEISQTSIYENLIRFNQSIRREVI